MQSLSLTGVSIKQENIVRCNRPKKNTIASFIAKLEERQKRYNIMVNRSKLKGKNAIFINESMTPDRKYLRYICNKLLMERQIHSY